MLKLAFFILAGAAIILFVRAPLNQALTPVAKSVAADRLALPPERQSTSNGAYRLEIVGETGWLPPTPTATLYNDNALLWQKQLPHQYGPRFALVGAGGQVVLLDEYINVASSYAIALIDPTGKEIITYSFDDIQTFLQDISRAELTRQAASGWWISNQPQLDETAQNALVETGGTTLQINLTTGELSRRDNF